MKKEFSENKKILFLYTEIAQYFLSCIGELSRRENIEVHIVKWPVNKEAPFNFEFPNSTFVYERSDYSEQSLKTLALKINPDIIYCAGWLDKDYLSVCKQVNLAIPVVLGFDNTWTGSLKQQLSVLYAKNTFLKYFSHCFIPGEPQRVFAKKLGFADDEIVMGVYSANTVFYNSLYEKYKNKKQASFPKRFIYVGRYVEAKGLNYLWQAFVEIQNEMPNEWELWCLGTGNIIPQNHAKIKHMGFVQMNEMEKYIAQTGVFILPSVFEPWGVVVHEFAAAGFPLICSNKVGAASAFVENSLNGFIFDSGNKEQLKSCLKKIMGSSQKQLLDMADKSVELSKKISPALWADTFLSILKNK